MFDFVWSFLLENVVLASIGTIAVMVFIWFIADEAVKSIIGHVASIVKRIYEALFHRFFRNIGKNAATLVATPLRMGISAVCVVVVILLYNYIGDRPKRMEIAANNLIDQGYAMATNMGCMVKVDPYSDANSEPMNARITSNNKGDKSIFSIEAFSLREGIVAFADKEDSKFTAKFKRVGAHPWKVSGVERDFAKNILQQVIVQKCAEPEAGEIIPVVSIDTGITTEAEQKETGLLDRVKFW